MNESDVLLALRNVSISFGGIQALDGVSLDVCRGEILGLIGPNGSGKTTCLNIIGNIYPLGSGEIHFLGQRIDQLPIHHVARRGIARTFQVARVFRRMTALENLLVPGYASRQPDGMTPAQLLQRARG